MDNLHSAPFRKQATESTLIYVNSLYISHSTNSSLQNLAEVLNNESNNAQLKFYEVRYLIHTEILSFDAVIPLISRIPLSSTGGQRLIIQLCIVKGSCKQRQRTVK